MAALQRQRATELRLHEEKVSRAQIRIVRKVVIDQMAQMKQEYTASKRDIIFTEDTQQVKKLNFPQWLKQAGMAKEYRDLEASRKRYTASLKPTQEVNNEPDPLREAARKAQRSARPLLAMEWPILPELNSDDSIMFNVGNGYHNGYEDEAAMLSSPPCEVTRPPHQPSHSHSTWRSI